MVKKQFYKSFQIGSACILSYMVSYYLRNLLSVTTPEMLNTGNYTREFLGSLSSVYMLLYAIGQLFNGTIGDIVKPKWMIFSGILSSSLVCILFSFTTIPSVQIVLFAILGFSLSMLRGPLVKTISENTPTSHSRLICTFFSFASFSGPLIASFLALAFNWQNTFFVAGIIAMLIAVIGLIFFSRLEKKGEITYISSENKSIFKNIFKIFTLKHFVFYLFIGAIAEISAASISFWLPSYFSEHLKFSNDMSNIIFSIVTIVKCIVPFISLIIFKMLNEKSIKMSRIVFAVATVFFLIMYISSNPYLDIFCIIIAQMAIGSASALLWNNYIPSQRESGMVSTINGVFDFSGYCFAAISNIAFAKIIGVFSWDFTIVVWALISFAGVVISFTTKD